MSVAYFDASAILAFLLQQPEGESALGVWEEEQDRASSMLLKAECLVSLKRTLGRLPPGQTQELLNQRLALLASRMEEISLSDVDETILSVLEQEDRLAECRTLDALHLATALSIRKKTGENVTVISLDDRLRRMAVKLGLDVRPT